jgi:hypothetical protein
LCAEVDRDAQGAVVRLAPRAVEVPAGHPDVGVADVVGDRLELGAAGAGQGDRL